MNNNLILVLLSSSFFIIPNILYYKIVNFIPNYIKPYLLLQNDENEIENNTRFNLKDKIYDNTISELKIQQKILNYKTDKEVIQYFSFINLKYNNENNIL
jgi:hypothetical protein